MHSDGGSDGGSGAQPEVNDPTGHAPRPSTPSDGSERAAERGSGPRPTGGSGTGPAGGSATQLVSPPRPPAEEGRSGRLLGGRYRLTSRLGHGGMGTVWRAHDEVVDRDVAVKEPRLPASVADRQRVMVHERMQREARAAARIGHPSVVTVHDVVVEDGQPWLVMELVRGESLADVLETGTLEPREAARIGLAVLEGLAAAHEAGVVHRDVKPANVLLGDHDQVVLTDFGIAHVEGEQGLTDTGAFVGSPEFTAPERAQGQRPGPESDLWSLGVLLYVAVEGVSPFRRNNVAATVQAVISTDPPPPTRAGGPLGQLITRLLDKRPTARPRADEVRRRLREILAQQLVDPTMVQTSLALGATHGPGSGPGSGTGHGPGNGAGHGPGNGVGNGAGGGTDGTTDDGTMTLRGRRRRRRGRLVVSALVAAVVLLGTALLVPASPVSLLGDDGTGLPEGWKEYDEDQIRTTLAVPDTFERIADPEDEDHVGFRSADGIYVLDIWHVRDEERGALAYAAAVLSQMQEDVWTYTEVDGDISQTEFQEREAAEMLATSLPYLTEEDTTRTRHQALVYAGQEGNELWRVQLNWTNAPGNAREYGEQLYDDIVENLEIRDAERPAANEG